MPTTDGSNDGVFFHNLNTGKTEKPFAQSHLVRGCIGAHIDKEGQLWIGSLTGLCVIDLKAGRDKNGYFKYRALRHKLDSPQSPVIDKICCFCEGKDGTLWLGSNGYGLYRRIVDKRTGKETFKVLTTDDGLANNSVKGIVEDLQGRLWITTNNGLSVYDPSTRSFRNYGEYDGLPSQRFYWNSAIKGADETLYLGSVDGICEVKGGNSEAIIPTHLTFTRLFVNNVPVVAGSDFIDADISQTDCIHLHESDRSFAVEFSCGNFCDDGIKRITILPLYNDFSLVCHRDDTHGTDMPNDFTGTLVPVRQTDGVPFHIQNDTVKDILRFYLYFTEFLHFFFKIKIHIQVPALMIFTKPLYHILSL